MTVVRIDSGTDYRVKVSPVVPLWFQFWMAWLEEERCMGLL